MNEPMTEMETYWTFQKNNTVFIVNKDRKKSESVAPQSTHGGE